MVLERRTKMFYEEPGRYRRKLVIDFDRISDKVVWRTPLVRHDDPDILKKLNSWERQLKNVAMSMNCGTIVITTELVPYKN
jgi:hypothetical protein